MDLIVSRVNGSLAVWAVQPVIELEDGTKWKQANAEDRFSRLGVDPPRRCRHPRRFWL